MRPAIRVLPTSALVVLTACFAFAQDRKEPSPLSAAGAAAEKKATEAPSKPDFKLVCWFKRSNPVNTFQCMPYNVGKGQYTAKVDEWLEMMHEHFPNYRAYVKPVWISTKEHVDVEETLAGVIRHERMMAGGEDVDYIPQNSTILSASVGYEPSATQANRGSMTIPGSGGGAAAYVPQPYPFPNPFPYTRPHP